MELAFGHIGTENLEGAPRFLENCAPRFDVMVELVNQERPTDASQILAGPTGTPSATDLLGHIAAPTCRQRQHVARALHVCLALDFIGRILDATMFGRSTVRNLFPQGPGVHTETVI